MNQSGAARPERAIEMTGKRFGRLTVSGLQQRHPSGYRWRCSCACGGEVVVAGHNLRNGSTQSCGCLPKVLRAKMQLHELLHYEPQTGVFTWRVERTNALAGQVAGTTRCADEYQRIHFNGKQHAAHRLAWLYVYGRWPTKFIDHINGDKSDNRLANLREVTDAENKQNIRRARGNSRVGLLGVCFHKGAGKYMAQIGLGRARRYLGLFATAAEAHEAYLRAKRDLHPMGTL